MVDLNINIHITSDGTVNVTTGADKVKEQLKDQVAKEEGKDGSNCCEF